MVLFVMEISYDLYTQAALDSGLQRAIRQIQTGNAQNLGSGTQFVTGYVCPNMTAVLNCTTNTYVSVQSLTFPASATTDYYNFTTGSLPLEGNTLDLTSYGAGAFCNGQPAQYLLVSAIYVGPTFVGGLLPRVVSVIYKNGLVHATLSTAAVVLESFSTTAAPAGSTPAAFCT